MKQSCSFNTKKTILTKLTLIFSAFMLAACFNTKATITENDITERTKPDTSHPGISLNNSEEKDDCIYSTYEFTNDFSQLAACGFVEDGLDTHSHIVKLKQPKGWNQEKLIILINESDGISEHIQPDTLADELNELPLSHDAFNRSFALLDFRNLLPQEVKYSPKGGGEQVSITKPLGKMMCSWIHYSTDQDEEIIAEMLIIKSIRTLIRALEQQEIRPKEIWVAGYQLWGRLALMARAIPEVKHVLVMGYERTALKAGLSSMVGSGRSAGLARGAAKTLMTSERAQSVAAILSKSIVNGTKKLLLFSDKSIMVDLTDQLENEEHAHRILELTQPTHWYSKDTTETVLLCIRGFKEDKLEPEDTNHHYADFRLFTPGSSGDLTSKVIVDALRSDMLRSASQLQPVIKLKSSGAKNSSAVLKAEGFHDDLSIQKITLMGPMSPSDGITDFTESGDTWTTGNFSGYKMVYADCLYTYKGLHGTLSSPLVKVEWSWSAPGLD